MLNHAAPEANANAVVHVVFKTLKANVNAKC